MGVSLPSDLILDVMRNADPVRVRSAAAKLQPTIPQEMQGASFASVLDDSQEPHAGELRSLFASAGPDSGQAQKREEAYAGFEQMMLRNLFEQLLPKAESGSFGEGPGAGVWRSMAADQLASIYADAGGIGISRMLEGEDAIQNTGPQQGQWPYFKPGKIEAFTG